MYKKYKKILLAMSDSKIVPASGVFGLSFFFAVDRLFKIKDLLLSQISILRFLIRKKYISRDFFLDRVMFKNMVLYDYIVYTFANKGFSRGTSFNQVEALGKCLGEVFERIPFRAGRDEVTVASMRSFRAASVPYLDLGTLAQATDAQKLMNGRLVYDDATEFEWVKVKSFKLQSDVYAPNQFVYWDGYSRKLEPLIKEQNTNGLASGATEEDALEAALAECLQRHVFFEAWYHPNKKLVVEVDMESLCKAHKEIKVLKEEAETNMLTLRVFRIKSDLSSVFEVYFSVLENQLTGGVYLGCSGGGHRYGVLYRSIQETFSIYSFTNRALFNGEALQSYDDIPTTNFLEGIRGNHRIIWWGHYFDSEGMSVYRDFLGDSKENYTDAEILTTGLYDKVVEVFGDFYYKIVSDGILSPVDHYACRVILPHSYGISLRESNSTPVLRGIYPQNTKAHIFP